MHRMRDDCRGLTPRPVTVEVDIANGLPDFCVGLAGIEVKEAKNRSKVGLEKFRLSISFAAYYG